MLALDDRQQSIFLDLTGKIVKEGRFPEAHGGFADVWKGVWHDGPHERTVCDFLPFPSSSSSNRCFQVAVKVLRSRINDSMTEAKMIKVCPCTLFID